MKIEPSSAYSISPFRPQAIVVSSPFGFHGFFAGVHQHETAGAVGVFGHARFETGLAEECGLLIAGDSGNRYLFSVEIRGLGETVNFAG